MSLVEHVKKRGLKDIFSKKIFSYFESKWQSIFGIYLRKANAVAYAEQVIFKRSMCPECYAAGACTNCGCGFEGLSTCKTSVCAEKRWGKIMKRKEWQEYKDKYIPNWDFGLVNKTN